MNISIRQCFYSGAILLFLSSFSAVKAQNISPRTGNEPVRQVLTQAEFDRQAPEIQLIIKDNPHLYAVVQSIVVVHKQEYEALPAERQQYIKSRPLEYRVEDKLRTENPDGSLSDDHLNNNHQ